MADKQEQLLQNLDLKVKLLMSFCDSLYEDNAQMKEELKKKNTEIGALSSKLSVIQNKYANLKLSKAFASGNSDEVDKAKVKLSKLVQDVEKCIFLLKK